MELYQLNWVYAGGLDLVTRRLLDRALEAYGTREMVALAGTARHVAAENSHRLDEAISLIFVGGACGCLGEYERAAQAFNSAQWELSRDPSWKQRRNEVIALYGLGVAYLRSDRPDLVMALARWQKGLAILKGARFYHVVEGLDSDLYIMDEIGAELTARINAETTLPDSQRSPALLGCGTGDAPVVLPALPSRIG